VVDCLTRFFEWYSSVHRGTGFKSLLSTHTYERCREVIAEFVGADLAHHTVIFGQNATHALNKLAMRVCPGEGGVVVTTMMEHHSNLLPWRKLGCQVKYANVNPADGSLDLEDMRRKIRSAGEKLCLVTCTAGSNVTGEMPPVRRIARMAHEHGALMALDATQMVPHRRLDMGAPDDPERIDFAAFSAHKMYAPFGSGVLVGPRKVFEQGAPDMVGGGTIEAVTLEETIWAAPPERDEAGTPNVLGAIAVASAARTMMSIGMDELAAHERELTRRALRRLNRIPGLTLYGRTDPEVPVDRLGVVTMTAEGIEHSRLAAVLGCEHGIGVRAGCFCAQPYVRELLGISQEEMAEIVRKLTRGDHATVPGMVRMSLGVYNTADEVDAFADAVEEVLRDGPRARYKVDPRHGEWVPDRTGYDIEAYSPF
jgi:selenocysteine lyase/cysteine desulfurase